MQISNTYAQPATMFVDHAKSTPEAPSDEKMTTREAFDKFVGEVFYGQLLKAMRSTQGKPAYFHGGQAEEIFQQQFDQVLTEEMTVSGAEQFTGPMFELFSARRS
jgi:Rod binding domain-containing protein